MTYTGLQNDINRPPVVGNILAKPRNRRDQGKRWGVLVGILQVSHHVSMTRQAQIKGVGYLARACGISPQAVNAAYSAGKIYAPYVFDSAKGRTPFWRIGHADRIAAEYLERGGWR